MIDKPVSPLRQRMIDDMTARRVSIACWISLSTTG